MVYAFKVFLNATELLKISGGINTKLANKCNIIKKKSSKMIHKRMSNNSQLFEILIAHFNFCTVLYLQMVKMKNETLDKYQIYLNWIKCKKELF